jgi:WD40-like Beta Propeller Repeat
MSIRKRGLALALVVGVVLVAAFAASAGPFFSAWSTAQKIDEIAGNHPDLNTSSLDGCPIESPDGLSLYMASNRPGGKGGLDIWAATRAKTSDPWGAPVNLPEPINSASDDFCPTPVRGNGLFFVSRKVVAGVTCGLGDIYFTRLNPKHGWSEPQHLDCDPAGPNSALDEQGPSYVQGRLYFSRSTLPPGNSGELYVSKKRGNMAFEAASPIVELNDAAANDIQPNVRKDGREIVFSSNRAGGLGGPDIWSATRASVDDPWPAPVNLGGSVNTGFGESRPSLSWDAQQLLFGRAGPVGTGEGLTGMSDIYVTTREKSGD